MEITGILKSWSHRACGTGWKKLAEFGQELVLPQNLPGLTSSYYPRHRFAFSFHRWILLPRIVVTRFNESLVFAVGWKRFRKWRSTRDIISFWSDQFNSMLLLVFGIGTTCYWGHGVEYALAWFNDRWIGNYDGFNYIGVRFWYLRAWKIVSLERRFMLFQAIRRSS